MLTLPKVSGGGGGGGGGWVGGVWLGGVEGGGGGGGGRRVMSLCLVCTDGPPVMKGCMQLCNMEAHWPSSC